MGSKVSDIDVWPTNEWLKIWRMQTPISITAVWHKWRRMFFFENRFKNEISAWIQILINSVTSKLMRLAPNCRILTFDPVMNALESKVCITLWISGARHKWSRTAWFSWRISQNRNYFKLLALDSRFFATRRLRKWRDKIQSVRSERLTHWWMRWGGGSLWITTEIWKWPKIGSDAQKSDLPKLFWDWIA